MLIQSIHPAVFLDKDGTLLEDVPYNVDPALMAFTPGAGEALGLLQREGYKLFVISNQSGVARGLFEEDALVSVRQHLSRMLEQEGVTLDGFYYCPHHPRGRVERYTMNCFCRKPSPGMLFQAAREHMLNLPASWMIGDILNDVECGRRANCGTILLENGKETEWAVGPLRQPHFTARTLLEAAQVIVQNGRPGVRPVFSKETIVDNRAHS